MTRCVPDFCSSAVVGEAIAIQPRFLRRKVSIMSTVIFETSLGEVTYIDLHGILADK